MHVNVYHEINIPVLTFVSYVHYVLPFLTVYIRPEMILRLIQI